MEDYSHLSTISENIGLTPLQIQLIIELMKRGGECSAPDLYVEIKNFDEKVKRTTVYSSLEKLKQENIIQEAISDNRTKTYGLINSSPEKFIADIKKPREKALKSFEGMLVKAKEEGDVINSSGLMAYYSLSNHKALIDHIRDIIEKSEKYLLIQANTLALVEIYPFIEQKIQNNKIELFIQITWNPSAEVDTTEIYEKYANLIGKDNIAMPHPFYEEVFITLPSTDKEMIQIQKNKSFQHKMTNIHFIQLLSDQGTILGTHFGGQEGGGHFTRDPYTTQSQYVLFFLIFESVTGKKVDRSIVGRIIKDRVLKNFSSVNHMQ